MSISTAAPSAWQGDMTLEQMVYDWLKANPDHASGKIAEAIGVKSRAVSDACQRLYANGCLLRSNTGRRYHVTKKRPTSGNWGTPEVYTGAKQNAGLMLWDVW